MNKLLKTHRWLITRRIVQFSILFLFVSSNLFGWKVLTGDLSTAKVLDSFHLADPYMVTQIFATGYIVAADTLIGALIVFLFYALIGGRAFCSWVCPINIVTESASRLRKILTLYRENIKVPIKRNVRYWLLALSIVLSFLTGVAAFEIISPIGMLHRGVIFGFGFGIAAIIFLFFFDLFVLQNGWCGYLCPLGAFYSLTNRFSIFKIKHTVENCTACNKCFMVCPEKQVLGIINKQSGRITGGECTNCGRCVEVCEDNSLKFSINNYKKNKLIR